MKHTYTVVQYDTTVYAIEIDENNKRTIRTYAIFTKKVYGRTQAFYADTVTGAELFPGLYFDDMDKFQNGYAMVVRKRKYFHINITGKIAYSWRFSDVGNVDKFGNVSVQHPRAFGWSLFNIPDKKFITNPPRYKW